MSVQQSAEQAKTAAPTRLGPAFAVIAAGVAMSNLDMFIVNVALPQIGVQFHHAPLASLSWVLNAYAVIFAALLVPAGNLADRLGARNGYLLGIAVFTTASVACSAAPGVWPLVGFRALQAAGAALLIPASLGLLLAAAPPARRIPAVRAWTAISGLAAALGPAAGGLLTQADWRLAFLVNVPVGVAVLVAGPRVLPRIPAQARAARPDLWGAALLTAAIAALALGVVKSPDWGWASGHMIGTLAACVVLLLLFIRRSARHPSPVLPPRLLRVPSFRPASLANVLFAVPFGAMLLSAVLWCQDIWHWSPLRTGLAIAPGPLMVPALAIGAGPLARRFGPAAVAVPGCLIFAGGIAWWIADMTATAAYVTAMLPGMLLTGIGVGLTLPTLVSTAVSALPAQSFATGSAVVTMARQLGTVVGVAALVAILGATRSHPAGAIQIFGQGWWFTVGVTGLTAVACLFVGRAAKAAHAVDR